MIDVLYRDSISQSLQFMVDLLPIIRTITAEWPMHKPMRVLDAGAGSGAGANLLATLYRGLFFRFPMQVEAVEYKDEYAGWSPQAYPAVGYRVGDVMDLTEVYDLVICSHVIEHTPNPRRMIRHLQGLARHWALFYAPYEEIDPIAEHVGRIDRELLERLEPTATFLLTSPGWHAGQQCVAFVMPGRAQ